MLTASKIHGKIERVNQSNIGFSAISITSTSTSIRMLIHTTVYPILLSTVLTGL